MQRKIKPDEPVNPLAYEYYLRVDLMARHNFPLAVKMLEKSAEIDPKYALTWAYLGQSYTSDATFEMGGREQYRRAKAAYERALSLQPKQLGYGYRFTGMLSQSPAECERARQIDPLVKSNGSVLNTYLYVGEYDKFIQKLTGCERISLFPLLSRFRRCGSFSSNACTDIRSATQ